ncbi:MAG: efflux RND transporter permease subunit [Gammaproteobacteria bacterium]
MHGIIRTFIRHPVAPNLAMLSIIVLGLWASAQLSRQLLPAFALNFVNVSVTWPGASAEDVEALVTQPLEDQLISVDGLRTIESTSSTGLAKVTLEFPQGTDMSSALEQAKDFVAQVRNLPASSEEPRITLLSRIEPVAKIIVVGPVLEQLRPLVKRFERELRAANMARFEVTGLPEEEISIELTADRLIELDLSLGDIAAKVGGTSADVPAGTVGGADIARQLRSTDQQRSVTGFAGLAVSADRSGQLLKLGDIARISRQWKDDQPLLFVNGLPAVEIAVKRAEEEDAIDVAERLMAWSDRASETLPPNVSLVAYDEVWRIVDERVDLMVSNALSGILLVVVMLYLFLNGRVAIWVAVGIPVSVLAALVALSLAGGSINVMTLFALIMTFGIIVDDAIVVAEEAVTRFQKGEGPAAAAENAAIAMFAPVTAASLTTIAAFLPLMAIGGTTGSILFAIPLVVICVIVASLIECFVILPGHLRHSLQGTAERPPGKVRRAVDVAINRFRDDYYRRTIEWSVENRGTVFSIALASMILIIGLLAGGRLNFAFFPQPEGTTITANVRFVAGSPEERVAEFLNQAESALLKIEADSGEEFIKLTIKKLREDNRGSTGSQLGHIIAEITPGDLREIDNATIISQWRRSLTLPPGLESFLVIGANAGPPGSDIDIKFTGNDVNSLKLAALDLQDVLRDMEGVSGIRDDTSYGREQLIFELSPTGTALGLTGQQLGEQLRVAFEGELVQIFQDRGEEVEVRVRLAGDERESLRTLETLPIVLPDGEITALANVARLRYNRGFDSLKHTAGLLSVSVTADVDFSRNNPNAIRAQLAREVLPRLTDDYGVLWEFGGDAANQRESVGDIGLALPLALLTIYIILAWVFASYVWPLAVLSVIPFGLVGAIFGHWLLGFDVSMLSIFGFFGLSGIVINDSIILVVAFKQARERGLTAADAAIEAGCRRLRAVLLTSITTVAGVLPLLLETALQAQFLKPMVISIGFGLMFGTLIVLFLLPTMLVSVEAWRSRLVGVHSDFSARLRARAPRAAVASGSPASLTTEDPTSFQDWSNK